MIPIYTITIIMAIGIQAFFTASEMAFTTADRIRMRGLVDGGNRKAKKLEDLLKKDGVYLGTTLVGTNIAVVISSVFATRVFMEYFDKGLVSLLTTVVMVPVTLVFAEIVPKILARQFSTGFAMNVVLPLESFFRLFYPLIFAVNSTARFLLTPFGVGDKQWDSKLSKSDLKGIVAMGHEIGEVESDELELIHKVLDFGAKKVESIMVPLYRVSSIGFDDNTENLKKLVSLTGFSRVPVYKGNKRNIIGIVNIYDVLYAPDGSSDNKDIHGFTREPVFLSRKDGLDIALARLRHQKRPMGVVVGENDDVVGVVTIEDILEEIVGEIEDAR